MRLIPVLLLLAASCASTVHAQAAHDGQTERGPSKPDDATARLHLTTSIVERRYHCSTEVGFKLRLAFKNAGSVPVILDKRSFIVRRMVSRTVEAAAAKQYELVGTFEYFDAAPFLADPSDMASFIVLKAGEVYAFDTGIGSFSIYDGEKEHPKGYLSKGTYFLQIEAGTWSYIADPKPFGQKWKDKGFLWHEGLTSLPMPFTVEKDSRSAECR